MEKYFMFRKLMDLMADYAEVVDADMNQWGGSMIVVGEDDDHKISIEVTIKDKEKGENEDA